ncbi:MAG: trypsin-like peptidase domain-containing protein [Candidatus Bathyarchaeota archaeon]|nr:trypsin-like peptidase domain-containing protein [Candidatus Bathyarchaeota archaeon]
MSNRTLKVVAIIAVVAIVFSAFNTYLILDRISVQEQLNAQEEQLNEIQNALEQLRIQNEQLDELQNALEQLNTHEERINELQSALEQLSVQEEQIEELQNSLEQLSIQQEQISELQSALNETRDNIEESKSNLSNLANQINALNQSTSTGLAEIRTAVETIEGLISDLSNLEGIVDQLLNLTPMEVYEATYKSVVVIRTPIGQGSGFLFNNSNMILTNYHVVTNETDIEIEFFDRTRTQATVIGSDAYSDIAVLTVPTAPAEAKPLNLGNQCSIGQQVVAIGNPLGLTESLSVGYISQVNRLLDIEPIIVPILQLDLTIAPGSSGGPLLDMSGNVVGITNAGTEVGFNFAVPVNIMKRVIPSLIEEGEYKHPFVGVYILPLSPEVITFFNIINVDLYQTGLLVVDVVPNLPADEAGLNPAVNTTAPDGSPGYTAMDIILAVDGHPTFTREDFTAYMEVEVSPGQSVTLTLWRSGVISSVAVTTTDRPPYQE